MNKETFLAELRASLSGLPQDELEERIAFYSEMIDDRMDEGATEEEAVAGIGSVKTVVEQIMAEIPLTKLVREKTRRRGSPKGWEIALLILGFPLWFPLLIAAAAVLFSLYAAVWAVLISLFAVDLSLAAGGIGLLFNTVAYMKAGNLAGVLLSVGAGMVSLGLAILFFFVCVWGGKWVIRLTRGMLTGVKTMFVGKEA